MSKRVGSVCAIVAAVIFVASKTPATVAGQPNDPSTLPRLSFDDLQYLGGFRLPAEAPNNWGYSYGGQAVAYDSTTNSLFVSSQGGVGEVSIPTPVNSSNPAEMPFAKLLQPVTDPTEGHLKDVFAGDVKMEGLLIFGNRLYGTAYIYYDAGNAQRVSHFSRARQLNQPSFSGWSQVWDTGKSGFVAGMMAHVPVEWQSKLGGPAITGQCCIPIITRTSFGPSAFAFNPSQVGQPKVPAIPLLYYPSDHATLGEWSGSNPTYGSTTMILGAALIAGSRTALYFGRNGMGPNCYGGGTPDKNLHGTSGPEGPLCYDPTNIHQAPHAYPYRYQIWAYDLNDFAAVKAGSKRPWNVVPYAVWPLTLPTSEATVRLGGVGYDAQRQLLYLSQMAGDNEGQAGRPLIHTFRAGAKLSATSGFAATTNGKGE